MHCACDCACRQALSGPLQLRGLSINDVSVFLESSYTPLPPSSDCFRLASSLLHVHCKTSSRSATIFITMRMLSPVHSSNSVETTLSNATSRTNLFRQSRTLLRHCCRVWQQCRTSFSCNFEVETNLTCSVCFDFA